MFLDNEGQPLRWLETSKAVHILRQLQSQQVKVTSLTCWLWKIVGAVSTGGQLLLVHEACLTSPNCTFMKSLAYRCVHVS